MALVVRCSKHGLPAREYCFRAEPAGGLNPEIHCGKKGCRNPGLVFGNIIDAKEYEWGKRVFRLPFHPAKHVTLGERAGYIY